MKTMDRRVFLAGCGGVVGASLLPAAGGLPVPVAVTPQASSRLFWRVERLRDRLQLVAIEFEEQQLGWEIQSADLDENGKLINAGYYHVGKLGLHTADNRWRGTSWKRFPPGIDRRKLAVSLTNYKKCRQYVLNWLTLDPQAHAAAIAKRKAQACRPS